MVALLATDLPCANSVSEQSFPLPKSSHLNQSCALKIIWIQIKLRREHTCLENPLKRFKYRHCPNWLNPPQYILSSYGALLRVNCNILQNATKQCKFSYCRPLKIYKVLFKSLKLSKAQKNALIFLACPPP